MASTALTGLYRGVVTDARDDSGLARLKVSIPLITGTGSVWAFPCFSDPDPKKRPEVRTGDGVWIMFEGGDRAYPVWVGFYGTRAP
jgi:hypothetical protein